MMRPIQFRKGQKINLNLLKSEIDRRIDVITMMVKGMNGLGNKRHSAKCQDISESYCQTEETHLPLHQIPNLTLSNTPSMKSLKSPTNSKRSGLAKNKENEVIQSFSITSKSKKLNPIEQSEQEALRTSRCMLESQKKKPKKLNLNQQSSKKSYRPSALQKKTIESNSIRDDVSQVITSFESARKANLTEKKSFQHFSSRNLKKFTTQEKVPVNFSVNSSIYDLSKSNSKLSIRKSSVNFNDSFVLNSSNNINKKANQSLSTNNVSSNFVSDYLVGDSYFNVPKRIVISENIKLNIQAQLESKLQNLKKKAGKQPKTNNIRISLLKRLEEKHQKTFLQTK